MMLQTTLVLVCLLGTSLSLPMRIGILASNSNEILRFNGLTLATLGQTQMQGSPMLPPYVFQQQPELMYTPQVVNLNPQIGSPFGPQFMYPNQGTQQQFVYPPNQGSQPLNPVYLPNNQQDQLGPLAPNAPSGPQQPQNPVQMTPQFQYPVYGYPQQQPNMQGYPYYLTPFGYPQRNPMVMQPNQGQVNQLNQPNQQTPLDRTTQKPQLPLQQSFQPNAPVDKTRQVMTQKETFTSPPENRGDAVGPGIDEGHSNFPFLFEP
ncbi:proline-rich proteoglycan 2 isoform X1 [Gadus macrocephalus]|uniref:proline-rich proteoglycan 2 isoform X1 n=1 Tax=Gadus macrocephalus TaxID=80720 RepID=UPI0028CB498F|nr:proline-rich proteoglycan 2 isoform X1 [Gadus macrocephalus]